MSALAKLRRYAKTMRAEPGCELCGRALGEPHRHLVELDERRLTCACSACALLFDGRVDQKRRVVPARVAEVAYPRSRAWSELGIPVGVAFCFRASALSRWIAVMPGPAGATEAELDDARWDAFAAEWPHALLPDVEALLVRTRRDGAPQAFIAPIDRCYELAGVLRHCWRGFDGGSEVKQALDGFFERLSASAEIRP